MGAQTSTPESPLRPQRQDEDSFSFSLEELEGALGKLKKNEAPGPDKVSNKLLLLMDPQTKTLLLGYYNQIWEHGEAPDSWKEAVVVSIYKGKGADTDPSNYRPISLLNAIYKLFAAMLQMRLADQRDSHLRCTQYGFRPQRGTRHPLFILRRAMEWSDMTNNPLKLLFLDWKQAFDSLDHIAMLIALERLGQSRSIKVPRSTQPTH